MQTGTCSHLAGFEVVVLSCASIWCWRCVFGLKRRLKLLQTTLLLNYHRAKDIFWRTFCHKQNGLLWAEAVILRAKLWFLAVHLVLALCVWLQTSPQSSSNEAPPELLHSTAVFCGGPYATLFCSNPIQSVSREEFAVAGSAACTDPFSFSAAYLNLTSEAPVSHPRLRI